MGFFRGLLGYGLMYHAAKSGAEKAVQKQGRRLARHKPVPFETTVKLRIPVGDDVSPEDLKSILSGIDIDVPPGISIDTVKVSASLDGEGKPESHTVSADRQFTPSLALPAFKTVGMSRSAKRHYRNAKHRKRAEAEQRRQEDQRLTMQELDEMDAFLKNHSPEEYEQYLLERNKQ